MTRGLRRVEQQRQRVLDQAERGDDVDLEGDAQLAERVVGQRGERRGAERPGVVDHEVEAAQLEGGGGEVVAVVRVGDVADDGDDRRAGAGAAHGCGPPRRPSVTGSRPSTTSDQPARASPVASASPSPRDAPVTMATLMAAHPSERRVRSSG